MTERIYTYSQLSSKTVGHMVMSQYGFNENLTCRYYVRGMHDNYLIESDGQKYILRIYRNNCRTEEEILFELEWLGFLKNKTDLVAEIIETKDGNLAFQFDSPEGIRFASIFRYASGSPPGNTINVNGSELLGEAAAYIHNFSDTFLPQRTRQALDIHYLLDDSIRAIEPFLDKEGYAYLRDVHEQLYNSMPILKKQPGIYGLCIGDVNPSNFHINKNNEITIFDFDQCGYGYRAFEIGKFFSSVRNHNDKQVITDSFLKGYQSIRPLSQPEHDSIPYFEIISVIWVMAIQVANSDLIGYKYLEKPAWDMRLSSLKKLVSAWPSKSLQSTPKSGAAEL
ncbi:MAG: phosphotransferase [Gammaproteobacteria bacterium]|nr:phosphotransferase [Gammaproteobacteria bacterium]